MASTSSNNSPATAQPAQPFLLPSLADFRRAFSPLMRRDCSLFWCYNTVDAADPAYWLMPYAQTYAAARGLHTVEMLIGAARFVKPVKEYLHVGEFWRRASLVFAELSSGKITVYQGAIPADEKYRDAVLWVQFERPALLSGGRATRIEIVRHADAEVEPVLDWVSEDDERR